MIVVTLLNLLASENLYEDLYRSGYHNDLLLTHSKQIVVFASELNPDNVLDVGCSHGLGVQMLWDRGIQANGIDISPTAIEMATKTRTKHKICGEYACFKVGNATHIPFPDKSFDTIISSDVIEHIDPRDIPAMVREFARVTKREMWLKIATKLEMNRAPLATLHNLNKHVNVQSLHTSIMSIPKWMDVFRPLGSVKRVANDIIHVKIK